MNNSKLKLVPHFLEYPSETLYFSNKKNLKEVIIRILDDLPDDAVNIELNPGHSSGVADWVTYDTWEEK